MIKNGSLSLEIFESHEFKNDKLVLFIPGAISSALEFQESLSKGKIDFNYTILSLRGRGKSSSPKQGYALEDQSSDVIACLKYIFETKKFTTISVFAHSLGVPIAMLALANSKLKVKHFIMCDYPPFYPPMDKKWALEVKNIKDKDISNIAIEGMANDSKMVNLTEQFKGLNCKLHLFCGNNESSYISDKSKTKMKELRNDLNFIEIKGGHNLIDENIKDSLAEIDKILKS